MAVADLSPGTDVKPGKYRDTLEEMLERFEYATDRLHDIREEAKKDMKYVGGDPWDPKDRRAREDAGRPVASYDELSQYTNAVVNSIRQHKRAIHVTPIGSGANDQTAEFRQNLFRQIEYRSNAEQQAYIAAFQNMVERSYGFFRIRAQYCKTPKGSGGRGASFNQELLIDSLPNPDLVTWDPDGIKPDGADWQYAWISESWDLDRYKRKFPKARVRDFSADLSKDAPMWMDARRIRIAEYFNIEVTRKGLYLFEDVQLPDDEEPADLEVFEEDLDTKPEFADLKDATPSRIRDVDYPDVKIYLTNGFEVLEKPKQWPGQTIPIVSFFGKILYVDDGANGAQKKILSLVRLARDPYMLYCYTRACEQEVVGMTPKVPYFVREGSLSQDNILNLQKSLHEPVAVIQVRQTSDQIPAGETYEWPQRNPYEPMIQPLEVLAEAARRAIQAAMGISPLPTQAQQMNEKSGVALKEIDDAEQRGSFHLIDAYEAGITRGGAILNEVCPVYYDTARTVAVRTPGNETSMVRINDNDPTTFAPGQTQPIDVGLGDHDVTISAGPSFDSEREAANDFADTLVENVGQLIPVIGPQAASKLMSLSVKLKNLGPIGDEISELLAPPDPTNLPPQIANQLQQLQGENQSLKQQIATDSAKATIAAQSAANVANINGQWGFKKAVLSAFAAAAQTDAKVDAENTRSTVDAFQEGLLKDLDIHAKKMSDAADRLHELTMQREGQAHEKSMQTGEQGHEAATLALEHAHAKDVAQTPPPLDPNALVAQASQAANNSASTA